MPNDVELRDAMGKAMSAFAEMVGEIEPEQWDLPSPCSEWSVRDVVDHVVAGERFVVRVLDGWSLADSVDGLVGLAECGDIVRQLTEASAEALAAFETPLDQMVDHPVGQITARRFLAFRIIDQLGHAWDLAAATGVELVMDTAALAVGVEIALTERETLDKSTNFATRPGDEVETEDPLTTLVLAMGRRPDA